MIDYYSGLTKKQVKAIDNERERLKITCKHCGRRKVIPVFLDRLLCDWCNIWIYRTPSLEFKYKMQDQMKRKD